MPTIEGELLRKWREDRGLTQEQLAHMVHPGTQKNRIYNIEKGPNSMSVSTLLRFVRALDVPGADEAAQLAHFFLGPKDSALLEAADEERRGRAALDRRLAGGGRAR